MSTFILEGHQVECSMFKVRKTHKYQANSRSRLVLHTTPICREPESETKSKTKTKYERTSESI